MSKTKNQKLKELNKKRSAWSKGKEYVKPFTGKKLKREDILLKKDFDDELDWIEAYDEYYIDGVDTLNLLYLYILWKEDGEEDIISQTFRVLMELFMSESVNINSDFLEVFKPLRELVCDVISPYIEGLSFLNKYKLDSSFKTFFKEEEIKDKEFLRDKFVKTAEELKSMKDIPLTDVYGKKADFDEAIEIFDAKNNFYEKLRTLLIDPSYIFETMLKILSGEEIEENSLYGISYFKGTYYTFMDWINDYTTLRNKKLIWKYETE